MKNFVRSHRLQPTDYYPEVYPKHQIYLHHTVSGSFQSVWNHWTTDKAKDGGALRVATAFIVDVNGDIYEVFDPKYWAHHLGVKSTENSLANKRSIAIELVSEGGLVKDSQGNLCWLDGHALYPSKRGKPVDLGAPWRGYQYFDAYDEDQIQSTLELVVHLCEKFKVPMQLIPSADKNIFNPNLLTGFTGVLTHCNVRADKSDVHPMFPWDRLSGVLTNHTTVA